LFFALRGWVGLEHGRAGTRVERFNGLERFAHWLTATCFVVLAITGFNLVFGRQLVLPLVGKEAFAAVSMWGKLAHDFLGFGFMIGLALIFVLWVRQNIPSDTDLNWLAKVAAWSVGGIRRPQSSTPGRSSCSGPWSSAA